MQGGPPTEGGGTTDSTSDYNQPLTQDNNASTMSYSNAVTQPKFPSKDQAIVFPSLNNITLQDYIYALGNITSPKSITFCSRISNNRICIYLSSKNAVDNFMNNHGSIKINEETIEARRLISPSKRLVLSNVCPSIPHALIESELQKSGLTTMSPITFLRVGVSNPEYSHILSFRRQVYIVPPVNNEQIPESFLVNFDNNSHRIFVTQDGVSCFKCKKHGHIASQCKENQLSIAPSTGNDKTNDVVHTNTSTSTATGTSSKRLIDETLTPPAIDQPTEDSHIFEKPSVKPKKFKTNQSDKESPTNTTTQLQYAKHYIETNKSSLPLNFDQLTDLIDNACGVPEPVNIVLDYCADLNAVCDLLHKVYPFLRDRSIKTRITKLRKKILSHLDRQYTDSESDLSQHSSY